ncbi:MAG: glutaredoxin, partial [Gemmatimonadales bacterium]
LLQDADREQLAQIFAQKLEQPVTVHLYTQKASALVTPMRQCQTCRETGELLQEVTGLSDKLSLEIHDFVEEGDAARGQGIEQIPALVFEGRNKGTVRYLGVPAGYEFSVLVESLVDVSRGSTGLAPETKERLGTIDTSVVIKVLVTPT